MMFDYQESGKIAHEIPRPPLYTPPQGYRNPNGYQPNGYQPNGQRPNGQPNGYQSGGRMPNAETAERPRLGQSYVPFQRYENILPPADALRAGTVFGDLAFPYDKTRSNKR
jgi:hypothetical protein